MTEFPLSGLLALIIGAGGLSGALMALLVFARAIKVAEYKYWDGYQDAKAELAGAIGGQAVSDAAELPPLPEPPARSGPSPRHARHEEPPELHALHDTADPEMYDQDDRAQGLCGYIWTDGPHCHLLADHRGNCGRSGALHSARYARPVPVLPPPSAPPAPPTAPYRATPPPPPSTARPGWPAGPGGFPGPRPEGYSGSNGQQPPAPGQQGEERPDDPPRPVPAG